MSRAEAARGRCRLGGLAGEGLALAAGALAVLGFAPFDRPWAGWLAACLLLLAWQGVTPVRALGRGFLFGLGLFGPGVAWVHLSIQVYGGASAWVAWLATAALVAWLASFPALAGALAAWLAPGPGRGWLAAPAWLLAEWLRGHLLTGFPWLDLGYSQLGTPLAGWAPVLGTYGVGGLLVLAAGATVALSRPGTRRWSALGILILLLASGLVLDRHDWTRPLGAPLRVALVQGNIPQNEKWDPAARSAILDLYTDLTRGEWQRPAAVRAQWVVWPEAAVPAFLDEVEAAVLRPLAAEGARAGSRLVTGVPVMDTSDWRYYNAIVDAGAPAHRYYKRHLVPFGEYVPLRRWLGGLLEIVRLPVADFSAGRGRPLLALGRHRVGASICYEIAFGSEIAEALPEAELLLNLSNDAWFGDSLAPHQHLEIARMRALETGRELLRATNTGITAIIDAHGRVRTRGPRFQVAVVRGRVQPRQGLTPYARWRDAPALLLALLALAAAGVRRRYRP